MVSMSHSYPALQRRLNGIPAKTRQHIPRFCGYAGTDVASQFIQRYAGLSVFEFTRLAVEIYLPPKTPRSFDLV
jgi:hypothetical protein